MNIAASLIKVFNQYRIKFQSFSHVRTVTLDDAQKILKICPDAFARSVLLGDHQGLILAVVPLSHKLDFSLINKRLKRQLKVLEGEKVDRIFFDCEPGSHPVIGEPYGLKIVIDSCLTAQPFIYFEPGTHTSVIKMSQLDFRFIQSQAVWTRISVPLTAKDTAACHWEHSKDLQDNLVKIHTPRVDEMAKSIEAIYPLPPLPSYAQAILTSLRQESVDKNALIQLIEQDPNASYWLVQYADSVAMSQMTSVAQVIDELGAKRVGLMVMGAVAGRIFQVPRSGPLGLDAFWHHTLCCAHLCADLGQSSHDPNLNPTTAFMCGLMHNFGFLLFGHLFQPEFKMLNKMAELEPHAPIGYLEEKILGMGQAKHALKVGHAGMGAWLLQSWSLAPEVIAAAKYHHAPQYQGDHQQYIQLLKIVNSLLKERELGDGFYEPLSQLSLESIGLTSDMVKQALERCQSYIKCKSHCRHGIAR